MESKLNLQAIEDYAAAWSDKLMADDWAGKAKISGEEMLALPVPQVGLLLAGRIYQAWVQEAGRLESPYFDYRHPQVQEALKKFMNVLSQHILVSREVLLPMLRQAAADTLLLVLSPYTFYQRWLTGSRPGVEELRAMQKFIRLNKPVLEKLLDRAGQQPELADKPQEWLDEVFAGLEEIPDSNTDVLEAFGRLLPAEESRFYTAEEKVTATPGGPEDVDEEEPAGMPTLNDAFGGEPRETLADRLMHTQQASGSLKAMLSINQKFMFINDLFEGSQEDFHKVLDFLDSCESKEAAVSFVHNNYLKNNRWKAHSPQVREFMALLDKKFS